MTINGSGTITGLVAGGLPDATITQPDLATGVAGTGPAFSAYQSSAQSVTANTNTKLQFQTEEFDTANAFDSTTNYRFTPQVAGYYQVNAALVLTATRTYVLAKIYKNGFSYKVGNSGNGTVNMGGSVSCLVYLNGSTDYIEAYGVVGVTQNLSSDPNDTWFQAAMIRGA